MDMNLSDVSSNELSTQTVESFTISPNPGDTLCNDTLIVWSELDELSKEKAFIFLPAILLLSVLIFVGTLGNALVIYIYGCVYRPKPSNAFIITMAVFDFLASSIVMPIDIYDMRYHYSFYNVPACKSFRYFDTLTTYGSAIILIQIAFDRFFKIRKPLSFNLCTKTTPACVATFVAAAVLSIPPLFLFGIRHREIPGYLFCGYDCSITQEAKGTVFEKIYYAVLLLLFLITFVLLLGLYISIWTAIRRRRRSSISDRSSKSSASQNGNTGKQPFRRRILSSTSTEDDFVFTHQNGHKKFSRQISNSSRRSRLSSIPEAMSRMRPTRTTKIFVAVSLAFFISYLPSILAMLLKTFIKDLDTNSSNEVQAVLKVLSRFHFLNNAINPVIYSFLNDNFRQHCINAFTKIFRSCELSMQRDKRRMSHSSHRKIKMSRSDSNKSEKSDKTNAFEMGTLKKEPRRESNRK